MTRLRVLSRQWCHLCDELLEALTPIARQYDAAIEVIDVDADPTLEAPWGELVPVVLGENDEALCHYHLDAAAVHAYLGQFPLKSAD
ncbi:MAG: glutaredoxin family protein [Rhodocyclaceae bacterium]|nr:glutaredoxin family protein [Rhodocyclaceae bacterium]MCB1962366.1 glutaredoxin family protein [Rhodocyclaceae bacterium]